MANLSWGKPTIEIAKIGEEFNISSATWVKIDTPVENTTKLNTEKGDRKEAKYEGGEIADVKINKNKYTFEYELYARKGKEKPIADEDGFIVDQYAVRLTPEDPTTKGFILKKTSVSVENTWDSEMGGKWKYTHEVLKPEEGKMVEEYTKG